MSFRSMLPTLLLAFALSIFVCVLAGARGSAMTLAWGARAGPLSFVGTLQPVTRTQLTQAMGLRRTTLRDLVARLIERGHVREEPNPRDGRSTLLTLTPEGQEIFDLGLPVFRRVLAQIDSELAGGLDEHEQAVRRVRVALQGLSAD